MQNEREFRAGFGEKGLPIGLDSFEDFQLLDSIYVDKTAFIHQMMTSGGKTFFLSRPRRFGKSLFLSTIKAVFEGKKELFKGLYIEDKIDWETYPVIKLDMTLDAGNLVKFEEDLRAQLLGIAANLGFEIPYSAANAIFRELLRLLVARTGKQVVVLVDEYDKPILDSIHDLKKAGEIRGVLQTFYGVLKASSSMLKFLMVSGITKVSQTSIFSGFNNLNDITLNPDYAGICGYTQKDLEQQFDGYVTQIAPLLKLNKDEMYQKIKTWYNGYSWDGATFVYNPFSVLRMFSEKDFSSYWFASGTPTFLLKMLKRFDDYSPVLAAENKVRKGFDDTQTLENMQLLPLFFQTGYLTIKRRIDDDPDYRYVLQIPNQEVRSALLETLVTYFVKLSQTETLYELAKKLKAAFTTGDTALAVEYLKILYSNAAYHQGTDNEGYYHNLFEIFCKFAGLDILIESRTDIGRIDSVIRFPDRTYIIEIKYASHVAALHDSAAAGLAQITQNNYIQPYMHQGKTVHLLGLAFTKGGIAYEEEIKS